MSVVRFSKVVSALPDPMTPDTMYLVRTGAGFDIRVTDSTGAIAHEHNQSTGSLVESDPTGITGADAITNIVSLTQAEYDAIGTPDASTLYVVT